MGLMEDLYMQWSILISQIFIGQLTLIPTRYLVENMDWFLEELGDFEDDYLIIDCPGTQTDYKLLSVRKSNEISGQVELYSHATTMKSLADALTQAGYAIFLICLY